MFVAVKSAKVADPDKYSNSRYVIGFDSLFSFSNFGWYKNGVIFGLYNSSSVHIDNKKKDICVLGKNLAQELDDRTMTAEAEYSINISRSERKKFWSVHYNGSNSF